MTSQLMNHEEAIGRLAAERYLLGEMKEEERAAFEEHFLNCAECLQAVTFGYDFMEQARPVARQLRAEEGTGTAEAREPEPGNFFSRVLAGLRNPAPAWAFALVLCLAGGSAYQVTIIRNQQKALALAKAPAQEFRYVITGQSRGSEKVITVRRDTRLSLRVELMPDQEFISYHADILSESNNLRYSLPLSVMPSDDSVTFSLSAGTLGSGSYSVIVRGQSAKGTQRDLASGSFVLRLAD